MGIKRFILQLEKEGFRVKDNKIYYKDRERKMYLAELELRKKAICLNNLAGFYSLSAMNLLEDIAHKNCVGINDFSTPDYALCGPSAGLID